VRYDADARYALHGNERASLLFLDRGHCRKRVGAGELELANGATVFLPPARLHADWYPVATTFFAAELADPLLSRLADAGARLEDHVQLAPHVARDLIARLRQELVASDSVSPLVLEGIVLHALVSAARTAAPPRHRRPPWLTRVRELLRDRALEPLRLRDIAAAVDVHPGHLSREFHRSFGVTPGEYVRQLRIEYAAARLADSDAPLAEIALAAGFADQAHFSRAFRRATGHPPREHRRMARATR
jgi:AraC family transcriptional regulator